MLSKLVLALFSKFEIFKTFLNNKISNFCLSFYFNCSEKKILLTREKLKNFRVWARTLKNLKNTAKKLHFFLFRRFYTRRKISLIKNACFMVNFLNLKSFPSYLFFVVTSSLSILCHWNLPTESSNELPIDGGKGCIKFADTLKLIMASGLKAVLSIKVKLARACVSMIARGAQHPGGILEHITCGFWGSMY